MIVHDNKYYDFVPAQFGGYKPSRIAPKVKFQADAGYTQQRERYPSTARKIVLEPPIQTQGEYNMLMAWLDHVGSDAFWYVLPPSLAPRPDGTIVPRAIWCRVIDEEIPDEPFAPGFLWKVRITLESIGPEVE